MATASGREIYVLGKDAWGNREVIVVDDGEEHNLPADAKYPYSDVKTRFPYAIPA